MAYWVQEYAVNGKNNGGYKKYMCDNVADISKLPKVATYGELQDGSAVDSSPCSYGSEAIVLETGDNYILSKETNEWVKVSSSGGSGAIEDLVNVIKGKSAYEIWEAKPENTGKSEDNFLESLIGPQGDPGEDGKPGDPGKNGENGAPGKDGKDGKYITAINFVKDETGAIISGEATFSDETTVSITVTDAAGE